MITYKQALSLLDLHIKDYNFIEKVSITECLDRILAQDISAMDDNPSFATASMDGYAISFSSLDKAFKIVGEIAAGEFKDLSISENTCIKTMTGALMPKNSDTLVPVEFVEREGDEIRIKEKLRKGFAVRKVAECYKKGEILLKKGTKLGFAEIALLAELGYFHITVFKKPVISILSTGSELKDLGESLQNPAQLRSSNHIALANIAKKLYSKPVLYPLLKDDKDEIAFHLESALQSSDIVVSTGGVSMGDFDFLKDIVKDYELIFDKVCIKPGKHVKIASFENKFILALPGFAYSAICTFTLFARHIIYTWLLQEKNYHLKAYFQGSHTKEHDLLEFLTCNLVFKDAKIYANLEGKKQGSSAIISNLSKAALLMNDKKEIKENELVDILLLP